MIGVACESCGNEFLVKPSRLKRKTKTRYCSMACKLEHNQLTTRTIRLDGYVQIRINGEFFLEHRVVMENHLGRKLETFEHVHHMNQIKHDNRLDNLQVINIDEHARIHHQGKQTDRWTTCECLHCKKSFERLTVSVKAHPYTFCSRSCYVAGSHKLPAGRNRC